MLEHGPPAEPLDIEAARAAELSDAQGDNGNLLPHLNSAPEGTRCIGFEQSTCSHAALNV